MLLVMVLMSSIKLSKSEQQTCLQVARESIKLGLEEGKALRVNAEDYSQTLQQQLASFVTLHLDEKLRGCIGALQAYQPLISDISEHAYAAAFQDPRFTPLTKEEYKKLNIEISVLGTPEQMSFESEEDLLQQIRPGVDGLIIEYGYNRGTFLPSVWEQLPDKIEFFNHLKLKANLAKNWWDDAVKVSRYETFSF